MSNMSLVPSKEKQTGLRDYLSGENVRRALAGVLPRHMTAEKVVRIVLMATTKTPLLLQCTRESLLLGVMQAASLGLDVGGVTGQGYLVPYRKGDTYEAQFQPGYRGLVDLARRSGLVRSIEAVAVHPGDIFAVIRGTEPRIIHEPKLGNEAEALTAVYAIARFKGGSQFEVMSRVQVDAIRKRSRAGESGPWVTDFDEMARKTVTKRLCKYLPVSPELGAAIELDNRAESGEPSGYSELLLDAEPEREEDATKSTRAKVAERAQAAREEGKE